MQHGFKRVAICLESPIDLRGGVSVLCGALIQELAKRCEVVMVSDDTGKAVAESDIGPFIAQHLPWNPRTAGPVASRALASDLVGRGVDLAHFHFAGVFGWGNRFPGHCPIPYLARLKVPCVSTVHRAAHILDGFCGQQRPAWFKLLMFPLAWWGKASQLRRVRFEVAVSQDNLRKLRRWYWPLRQRFVQIYHARLPQQSLGGQGTDREKVILNVGHIVRHKGQSLLVKVFAEIAQRYPEWTLRLVGHEGEDGSVETIRRVITTHGLGARVQLLGERTDTFDLMRRAAIYVQPSFNEALGLALQEAMACGCPCVGTRAGGIPELIEDGRTGLLIPPENPVALRSALESLINDEGLRSRLGRNAERFIEASGMSREEMIRRHLEMYERIARN